MDNKTREVLLFSSLGCHLCEQAEELLHMLQAEGNELLIEKIEITDSEALVERYGVHIPVLRRKDNQQELFWPFNKASLSAFLDN